MIIVSSNKEKIKRYNNTITINYDNDYETKEEFWIVVIDGEDMGHYKTRERAKEVLQEITNEYKNSFRIVNGNLSYPTTFPIPIVYEMPEA